MSNFYTNLLSFQMLQRDKFNTTFFMFILHYATCSTQKFNELVT